MKQRLSTFFLALLMGLSLSACGGNDTFYPATVTTSDGSSTETLTVTEDGYYNSQE